MNKKSKYIFLGIIGLLLLGLGGTYALITLALNVTNGSVFGSSACFDVEYGLGNGDITGTLFQTSDYTKGLNGSVSLKIKSGCSSYGTGSLYLNINGETSDVLTNLVNPHCEKNDTLETVNNYKDSNSCIDNGYKWITKGTALKYVIRSNENYITSGYITNEMIGNNNLILNSIPVNNSIKNYDIYLWLDGNLADNTYNNLSFTGNVNAKVVYSSNDKVIDFDYTGEEQVFVVPVSGYYKLETWGAQGGSTVSGDTIKATGGYGGYSTGEIYLQQGYKLYINVGGKGTTSTSYAANIKISGGYNGGGYAFQKNNDVLAGGGGGATHIAIANGLLYQLEQNKDNIILVASGGSGAYSYAAGDFNGNSGGGYIGGYSRNVNKAGTQTTGYAFGQAADLENVIEFVNTNHSGGGGGYYGGHSAWDDVAGGGSGYIGNINLSNKHMTCYNCTTSDDESTKTLTNQNVSDNPVSDYSKKGNGFVRISYTEENSNVKNFSYTGGEQVYVVPVSGNYKLETWGAQGGSYGTAIGGYGGYSTGEIYLRKGEKIYINVGGTTNTYLGGYNGGGRGPSRADNVPPRMLSGGGGATHMALKSGILSSLSNDKDSILIVSGGGGGIYHWENTYLFVANGGSAGGYIGNDGIVHKSPCASSDIANSPATGGTQLAGGIGNNLYNGYNGDFGQGGNVPENINGAGGGGGYYGGGATRNVGCSAESGGGGSGYIGNNNLKNKYMACYECVTSDDSSTKTVLSSGTNYIPISGSAKKGNGYAKITLINTEQKQDIKREFGYTGGEQTYIVPVSGYYKLETWGAQGGMATGNNLLFDNGGYGGYSVGTVYLEKNSNLYINIGGQGNRGILKIMDTLGGYNGGGMGHWDNNDDEASGGGGGATHIATVSGLLSDLSEYAGNDNSPILIVSGGGGSVVWSDSSAGNAGGFKGTDPLFGQTTIYSYSGTQDTGYGFGQGGNGVKHTNTPGGGGGGGYYGGFGGQGDSVPGAGGSSYIGNINLLNKHMTCYNCETSNDKNTKTISTTNVSHSPIPDYAKKGNGYAIITYVGE